MKVLISGAGVGGLAAARALIADGHDVTVFEQADGLRRDGAAVTLWSNGTGVLSDARRAPRRRRRAHRRAGDPRPSRQAAGQRRRRPGRRALRSPARLPAARRLLERLAGGLPPGRSRSAARGTGMAQDGSGVRAEFADGTTAHAGPAGRRRRPRSAIRDQLWGGDPAELTGWATWQGLSPVPVDITSVAAQRAVRREPAGLCGLMPAGDGLLQWWFDQRWAPGTPPPAKPVAALRARFGDWAAAGPRRPGRRHRPRAGFFPHYRHAVPRTWGSGRVTVIGDAAHSMPPTRAQGANQALEDAWALAARAAPGRTAPATPAALRAFERARSPKARPGVQARRQPRTTTGTAPSLSRLIPSPLATRYYTRWLGQISTYLTA